MRTWLCTKPKPLAAGGPNPYLRTWRGSGLQAAAPTTSSTPTLATSALASTTEKQKKKTQNEAPLSAQEAARGSWRKISSIGTCRSRKLRSASLGPHPGLAPLLAGRRPGLIPLQTPCDNLAGKKRRGQKGVGGERKIVSYMAVAV